MINGRLKQIPDNQVANLLRSYSASDVKNVEVIYHTGAEFDASGNYGIINFIMDKPKEDFVGGNVSNDLTISDYASNESILNLRTPLSLMTEKEITEVTLYKQSMLPLQQKISIRISIASSHNAIGTQVCILTGKGMTTFLPT